MKTRLIALLSAFCLLFCPFVLASCSYESVAGVIEAQINENGELILTYQNGKKQNLGVVIGKDGTDGKDGADGATVITGENGSVPIAVAKGLRSAVSIICKFTMTVQSPSFHPAWSNTRTEEYSSSGSGVIYRLDRASGDAFIITNYHVVYDSSSDSENGISEDISVYLYGSAIEEKAIKASYVGGSLYYDIAVLRVSGSEILKTSDACAAEPADSDLVAVGESAIAVGNAQGLGISASFGVVSVDSEYITMTAANEKTEVSLRVMRVDAAVNSGNSGGGLYDGKGRLIGIVNAKIVDSGVENIGYAIPSNVATSIADNIIDYCSDGKTERVQRAMLGITVATTDSKAVYNSASGLVEVSETVSIYEVSRGSLADGVLKEGDILVSATLDGEKKSITRQYHIIDMMLDVRVGDVITLEILRDGESTLADITISSDCLTAY